VVDRVLVPVDDSPLSSRALEFALAEHADAEIVALHVIDYIETSYGGRAMLGWEELETRARERSEAILADARERAESHDIELTTVSKIGRPERVVVDYVEAHDIDLVVIGSHGRSIVERVLLGSVAETVARRSSVPVTLVR
jgi:nucleotide-binding universal stress UspA family protein